MIRLSMGTRRSTFVSVLAKAGVAGGLVSALMLGAAASALDDRGAEAKALAKLDDDWSRAAASKDAKRVAAFHADDAIAYPPNEPMAVGRAAAEKVWAAYFADPTYKVSWTTARGRRCMTCGTRIRSSGPPRRSDGGALVVRKWKVL